MSRSQPYERVIQGGIKYSINEEENTASVAGCQRNTIRIIIPRAINHKSKEYIVTTISSEAFKNSKVKSVEFASNSELQTIGEEAFSRTKLASIKIPSHVTQIYEGAFYCCEQLERVEFASNSELRTIGKYTFSRTKLASIEIPASVVELKDGWCRETDKLHHVEVESGNAVYASVGGKCIIGKSDNSKEDYDILVFIARDTNEATIPGTIKIIGSYAFSDTKLASIEIPSHVTQICEGAFYCCHQLERVEFASNSELRTIGKEAFSCTKLASIEIPSHVTQIYEGAFYYCEQLERVEFASNSELQAIGKYTFSRTKLASIEIPASVVELKDGWCYGMDKLYQVEVESGNAVYASVGGKCIIGKSDNSKEDYDILVFIARDTNEATIPGTIKIIGSYAFSDTKLASIEIPSHVTQICEGAFYYCEQLERVEFASNSELQAIGKYTFSRTKLASIEIPSHVTQIYERAFFWCRQLQIVEIEGNSVDESFYKDSFGESKIIMLPSRNDLH